MRCHSCSVCRQRSTKKYFHYVHAVSDEMEVIGCGHLCCPRCVGCKTGLRLPPSAALYSSGLAITFVVGRPSCQIEKEQESHRTATAILNKHPLKKKKRSFFHHFCHIAVLFCEMCASRSNEIIADEEIQEGSPSQEENEKQCIYGLIGKKRMRDVESASL